MSEQLDPFDVVGVLHLLPLPGGPRASAGLAAVRERALADARVLARGGVGGCIVENIGDAPFPATTSAPHVAAMMASVVDSVRAQLGEAFMVGVNVLRNDAPTALGVAAATGARFIRTNVLAGAAWTDQGLIQGAAHELLRYRRELDAAPSGFLDPDGVSILADVLVKHAEPAGSADPARVAQDLVYRAGADGLIITGQATGSPASPRRLRTVRDAVPEVPLWLGSGVTPANIADYRGACDGAIVGTWFHQDGRIGAPLDVERVRALMAVLGSLG